VIVMLGSALDVRGGVSAMARVCEEHGLFRRRHALYLASHCDGSAARKAGRALRAWLGYAGWLATGRVTLLHAHLNSGASFWRKALFVVPGALLGVPFVLQVHCGRFPAFAASRGALTRRLIGWMFRRARIVVALSDEAGRELARIEPAARIEVLPNPVMIPAEPARLDGRPTALFLGMLTAAKGVHDLLAAWRTVLASLPEARLVLAGAGDIDSVKRSARALGIGAAVEIPGWVDADGKMRLLRQASVLVLPSHHEALPMAILEAMAAGVPVVATRVGGIPGAVDHGRSGLLVPPAAPESLAQALLAVLGDPGRRAAMGAAAREKALGTFSADVVVPRLEAIWDRATGASQRQPHRSAAF
jgi:glycosyltransferase involved in cell wall biosynthesis